MRQVVPPSARAGHRYRHVGLLVHLHDETVLLDQTSELSVPLAMLTSNRQPHDDPVSRSALEDVADLQNLIKKIMLTTLKVSRCRPRRGGASEVLPSRLHSAHIGTRRGRRRSESSLRRHRNETNLFAEVRQSDPLVIEYGKLNMGNRVGLPMGRVRVNPLL